MPYLQRLRFSQFKFLQLSLKRLSSSSTSTKTPATIVRQTDVVKIPDENPDLPKSCVFQGLTQKQRSDSIYTLEEAAKPVPFHEREGMGSIDWKYPTLYLQHTDLEYAVRGVDNQDTLIYQFPERTDFLIVGSGLIGSATAYYAKKEMSEARDVLVLDKDPYSPHNCTALCNGLISAQSKSRDISRMANLSKELIRNLRNEVLVTAEDFAQIKYRPCTHLILWPESEVEEVMDAVDGQIEDGCFTELKMPLELEDTFPWLKVGDSDVALGSHGNQDEALVDPIGLRNLYRTLAQAYGANFIQAEVVDFNTQYAMDVGEVVNPDSATAIVARLPATCELKSLGYNKTLLCLGHNTPYLEARSEIENNIRDGIDDMHFLQPKLRISFEFNSQKTPLLNFPVITDTDGSMLHKQDFAGNFIYYLTLEESETFLDEDISIFMDPDSDDPHLNLMHTSKMFKDYFNTVIKPRLVKRIPLMEDAKFNIARSGFESVNTHDGCPIVGLHPFHNRVMLSAGYGSRMMNFAPAVAVITKELYFLDEEETFDVTNFYWNRVINRRKIGEFSSLIK